MSQPDAIIIGTGVIGAAIAFEMAKAGWKTLSLDRNSAGRARLDRRVLRDHSDALFDLRRHRLCLGGLSLLARLGRISGPAVRQPIWRSSAKRAVW